MARPFDAIKMALGLRAAADPFEVTLARADDMPGDVQDPRRVNWASSESVLVVLAILLVTYLGYFLVYVPALYSADWRHIVWGNWTDTWLDFSYPWPLLKGPFFIQNRLLGINITAYYLILGAAQIFQAMLLYSIARLITRDVNLLHGGIFSLAIALLFLIYPTVYTKFWLTMLFFYSPALLALLYGYMLVKYAENGHLIHIALAILFLAISLGMYETHLGIVCAWALILLVVYRRTTIGRRLALLAPLLLVGMFIIWRTVAFEDEGDKHNFLTEIAIGPSEFLSRLFQGYKISFGYSWTITIEHLLPWLPTSKHTALLAVGGILILWLSLRFWGSGFGHRLSGHRRGAETRPWPLDQRWPAIRSYSLSGLIGLVLVAAGYVPIVLTYSPRLGGSISRLNFLGTIGSAVFLLSVLMIGALIFAINKRQVNHLFLVATIPFILLGIVAQNLVHANTKIAWEEQKSIYKKLFSIAPNFQDNTTIVLVLPGYGDRVGNWDHWRRRPIAGYWSASSAIQLFYDNPTLSADVTYPDGAGKPVPGLSLRGFVSPETGAITPYAQSVFLEYDSETNSLRPLTELPADSIEGASDRVRLRSDRILSTGVSDVHWRGLVADR